jgi:hypothetical protein
MRSSTTSVPKTFDDAAARGLVLEVDVCSGADLVARRSDARLRQAMYNYVSQRDQVLANKGRIDLRVKRCIEEAGDVNCCCASRSRTPASASRHGGTE